MQPVGNCCVSFAGEGAAGADIGRGAGVDAISSNPQHEVKNKDALSYWACGSDPIWTCEVNQYDNRSGNSQSRQVDKCLFNFCKQFAKNDVSLSGPVVSRCASFVAVLASWVRRLPFSFAGSTGKF
jgi:hypothetical protein